jgi:hypothetical protein
MSSFEKKYQDELGQLDREIEIISRLDAVNSILHKYNWVFLHPYSQGMDIGILEKYIQENSEEKIFSLFASKFLDLRTTICFLDGFYKKRPYLKDYGEIIEQSIILCLQKDYGGAITLLLPVIEGTLRKYLISKTSGAESTTNISSLLKALDYLLEDYLALQREYLQTRTDINFSADQQTTIEEKNRTYFSLWLKQLRVYLNNNLYCDTRTTSPIDKFNRHLIFHALEDDIDYSFRNYLRLINCINFISWAIGNASKGCSVLADISEDEVRVKWVEYLKILIVSETLTDSKTKIYGTKIESFKPYLDKTYIKLISVSEIYFKSLLSANNVFK